MTAAAVIRGICLIFGVGEVAAYGGRHPPKEIRAKAGAPIWRRDDETGRTFAIKLTAAGAKASAVDDTGPSE